jgi:hypothetical protein
MTADEIPVVVSREQMNRLEEKSESDETPEETLERVLSEI